jgi:hypothetical protein
MTPQEFLLQECKNVALLLDHALRYEYGLDGSYDFYNECDTRLRSIHKQISASKDPAWLTELGRELNELSKLICRIERSSLGEYSWPFVEELKEMADAICIENSAAGKPSKIYVLADGGLDAYGIFPEVKKPSYSNRLLLTIVFPKSLKHFVLLHSILGHELGHAIWNCSKNRSALERDVRSKFVGVAGVFGDEDATRERIFANSAPLEAQEVLRTLATHGIDKSNFFLWAKWESWIEEIMCDLVGLVAFGPSFVAAQCNLLPSINPNVYVFGDYHPPPAWRINLILRGATYLGFDSLPAESDPGHVKLKTFWETMHSSRAASAWCDVLSDDQLFAALDGISNLLMLHSPAGYKHSESQNVWKLTDSLERGVPPVNFELMEDGVAACARLDFRTILYAGWITSVQGNARPFETINRLCEHAMMQQRAINIQLGSS